MKIPKRSSSGRWGLPRYALGALGVLAAAEVFLFLQFPVVRDFFYIFAWWPYIVLVDGLVFRQWGWSLLASRPGAFLSLLPWSVTFWLVFELFNLRLENWHYVELVGDPFLRWPGYTLAFATVLPALFETSMLLEAVGVGRDIRTPVFAVTPGLARACMAAGAVFLVLPLAWPRYFFPLVWGGFVLLVDPINARLKAPSLLADLALGRPQKVVRLLLAGLGCGLLWEFWNYWARAKWVYSVPYVGDLKLFEMPVLGFLGFPPFALECFVLFNFVGAMGWAEPWERHGPSGGGRSRRALLALVLQIPFWAWMYFLIDRWTVLSFR